MQSDFATCVVRSVSLHKSLAAALITAFIVQNIMGFRVRLIACSSMYIIGFIQELHHLIDITPVCFSSFQ